jgi:uncharacterized protein YxeA
MKKSLAIYYGLLTSMVLLQVIATVFTLSQNIGYGQKISYLENQNNSLKIQKNDIAGQLAEQVAIKKLEQKDNSDFIAIADVLAIKRSSTNLALK